jgi:hypothetical protein
MTCPVRAIQTAAKELAVPLAVVNYDGDETWFPVYDGFGVNVVRQLVDIVPALTLIGVVHPSGRVEIE